MISRQILQISIIPCENVDDFVPKPTIVGDWEIYWCVLLLQLHKPNNLQIYEELPAFYFIFFILLVFGSMSLGVHSLGRFPKL